MSDNNFQDERLKKDVGSARASRQASDRKITDSREWTDEERLQRFRMQTYNDALPKLPDIPGYHTIWLTTENPSDPINWRMQLGYQPITQEDAPGLSLMVAKDGDFTGMIKVREMLAFKISEELYQAYMRVRHHDEPHQQEESINADADRFRAQAERDGSRFEEYDGMDDMRHRTQAPAQFG